MRHTILIIHLLFARVGLAQEVISYTDSKDSYPTINYRLLEDSIYTSKRYPDPSSKIDPTASYHYDYEAVKGINRTIREALGEERYQMIDTETGNPKVVVLTLYIDSTKTIKEIEFYIKHTELEEEDLAKIAIALKGTKFEVPPYYSEFAYIKLDVSFQLLNTEFL